ncbi:pilus assembly protein N-terminal domain-containing protein [Pannonibacter phragmitetus]|uniref:pilus assembly protein N-terminal domain-containing protein n=1 Tax=Pannonibacter phragmitetus TaxID=121719 RepID=UPI003D2EE4D8
MALSWAPRRLPRHKASPNRSASPQARAGERILRVGLGRSVVVDIAEDVADVLVSEPEIANATVRSRNRIYVVGNKAGQASVVLFGTSGREIASFSVRVEPDTSDLNAIIRKLMPNTDIRADLAQRKRGPDGHGAKHRGCTEGG